MEHFRKYEINNTFFSFLAETEYKLKSETETKIIS
jgi:hypothetical protein